MRIMDSDALSGFAARTAGSTSGFAGVVHSLVKDLFSSYRPELHFMRGPGPKWRARHRPWLRLDSETLPRAQQPEPSTVCLSHRDVTNHPRAGRGYRIVLTPVQCVFKNVTSLRPEVWNQK